MKTIDIENADLNLLRVFAALVEEGGASRAAIRLGVTQPAVSASLARLREIYSDPLFERTGRGLRPTMRASELYPLVEEAINRCRLALAMASDGQQVQGRTLTIGLSDDSEIALGQKILSVVEERLPGLRILFRQTHSGVVQDMLMGHKIDLAISAGGLSSHLITRIRLGRGNYLGIADAHNTVPVTAEDYAQRPHLLVSSAGYVGIVDEGLNNVGLTRTIKASTSHFAAVPFLLVGSKLITTVPTHAARAMERISSLQTFPCPVPMPSYELEIGMRVGSKHDNALQIVKSLLLDSIKEHFFLQ
ncbi:LysR family transcriptional activator of mexEF-oprN operon [Pseudomonas protegens]|uniref:LysR family transcriptional regulator n=1 Tax=Pseudomonas TaxID=286 RepID=UPI000876F9D9|nr:MULTISPECIES: LysR family transcriptional regulator [unclassified Pseudomonas]SCZ75181.1 DNA-binding transcriptional regulator, LysR family [Pseudomonas sp. NFPP17]SDA87008.1 DNA-binding transcriptional regulator, LysR family [Pseudomonas sp. NFPP15]SEL89686.1 DNA-binding transcriptional regulator, LysR family [Pseudomonas sp. NFPP18]SFA67657.1 DNA-binding transcriptional regulator, LysR family [Pseudomonas sp. NFPP13]SFU10021.1 DNA-binding transcriptional regulator, LysR family [Pseudomona